jgi:hypothetical protein
MKKILNWKKVSIINKIRKIIIKNTYSNRFRFRGDFCVSDNEILSKVFKY